MSEQPKITFGEKQDAIAPVDRERQSTADDWNQVRATVNAISEFLHVESNDISLSATVSHAIIFDADFSDANYCIQKLLVYRIDTDGGDETIVSLGVKNIVKTVSGITFDTYDDNGNKFVDYYIMQR